jgi:putative ABC transport system permease protein
MRLYEMKAGTILRVALRHISSRPFQTFSVIAVIAFSSGLAAALYLVASGLRSGLVNAVEPFDVVVGVRGSPYQLVLNAVFLQDVPAGNIRAKDASRVLADPRAGLAVPIALGDTYDGFPVVGTTRAILKIKTRAGPWLQIREGRFFSGAFEAVVGAKAAALTGLKCGDTFRTTHGAVGGEDHEELFRVVGVCESVRGPYDRAILVGIESVWAEHGHAGAANRDKKAKDGGDVTAILIKPKSYSDAYNILASYQRDQACQAVFPAQTTVRLFSVIGRGEEFLRAIVRSVAGCTLLTTVLILYWSGASRRPERELLYILGVSREILAAISWIEGALLLTAGVTLGWILGRAGVYAAFSLLGEATAIEPAVPFGIGEISLPAALLAAGALGALAIALADGRKRDAP